MRKKPKPLLSQAVEEFSDGEWLFVYKQEAEQIVKKEWVDEFLFYELSRGLIGERRGLFDPCAYLEEIAEGWFPDVPFLDLPPNVQAELVKELRKEGSFFDIHILRLKTPGIFQVNVSQCLTDEVSEYLEDVSMSAAASEAAGWKGLDPNLFLPLTNPGEKAVAVERNRMIETGMKIFEPGRFRLTLQVDFEVPDHAIIEEFSKLLKSIRSSDPAKEWEKRGKVKDQTAPLRDLAALRLKTHCGSHGKVETFRMRKKQRAFPIKGDAGWNKSVKRGEKMVDDFKSRFGAKVDPGRAAADAADEEST